MLLSGASNKAISTKLKIPVSTVQRRTRLLFERGIVMKSYELNYPLLGLRKGILHVYLNDGNSTEAAEQVSRIPGIVSTSIHIGNSDIVATFVFRQTQELLEICTQCKKLDAVDRVVWSEEVESIKGDNGKKLDS